MTVNILEDAIKSSWGKVKKYFKDLSAKEAIEYGSAYEIYLKNTKEKNGKIKTLIYRHTPKDLYSFYECIGLSYNGYTIDTKSIINLIEVSNKIIITGTGGIGKTMLIKHLFLNTINETSFIPVMIELRAFNIVDIKEISIYDSIYNTLFNNGFILEKEYFDYSLQLGAYIILFDGYDEVNREIRAKITNEIKSLSNKYNKNKYIVTSRPTDEFIGWSDFVEMSSKKLTKEQALSLIKKIDFEEITKDIFYKELQEKLYDKYNSFASNPLLLTIMLLTFDNRASIPDKLNDFYEQAFATLFNMHDATKDAYVRDISSGLGCEDFKLVFAYLCFKSYFSDVFEFSESKLNEYIVSAKVKLLRIEFKVEHLRDDLIHSVCMLVKEGLNYRFAHRSFQEYFAAWYTCKLTDDIQSKLLIGWLKESDSVMRDSYMVMLYNLQSEKFSKIILCPGLKMIKILYEQNGFTINFLEKLFKGVNVHIRTKMEEEKNRFSISLQVKDKYLCNILRLTCLLNNYEYIHEKIESVVASNISMKSRTIRKNSNISHKYIDFLEISEMKEEKNLLLGLKWFENQVLFGINILEQFSENSISKKRKVASILLDL